jgi:Bacterial CdiA-CT RNAse A domain
MSVNSIDRVDTASTSLRSESTTTFANQPSVVDSLITTARAGSPVDAGNALRALDSLNGRAITADMMLRDNELPAAQPAILTTDGPVAQVLQVQDARSAGRINLLEHEGRGMPPSHTISLHVGKSREFLLNMMQPLSNSFFSAYRTRHSTFSSLESANALVSATLARGEEVRPGEFYLEFSRPTGTAAVRRDMYPIVRPQGRVSIEAAYGVLVITRPDAGMPGGFRVQTAYPTIPFSGRGQ